MSVQMNIMPQNREGGNEEQSAKQGRLFCVCFWVCVCTDGRTYMWHLKCVASPAQVGLFRSTGGTVKPMKMTRKWNNVRRVP